MPDARLARTRATLPPDYQFGDARLYHAERRWRALHDNAGDELRRKAVWGDRTPRLQALAAVDPHVDSSSGNPTTRAKDSPSVPHWNVIEGDPYPHD